MDAQEDHRDLARRLDLFHLEEAAPGMVFWHPRGFELYRRLEAAVRGRVRREGYQEVRTPQILRRSVWEESGHWQHFRSGMFCLSDGSEAAAIKPVSCPGHAHLVRRRVPSYRELPIRISELGLVHRDEPSGALQGLLRLRQFTQDDGHVFCRQDQVEGELERFLAGVAPFYAAFGFEALEFAVSLRPEDRAGAEPAWDRAEAQLQAVLARLGYAFEVVPGAGAFYGPKVEIGLKDRAGRSWQCGTIQLDVQPERFGLEYADAAGGRSPLVMLHRALYGSLERFLAMVLEHHGAQLPPWLAPEQVVVLPVGEAAVDSAQDLLAELERAGLAASLALPNESLGRRVALARERGVPQVVVLGPAELAAGAVAWRRREGQTVLPRAELGAALLAACRPPAWLA